MSEIFDLRRVTSPHLPRIDADVAATLAALAADWPASDEMRQHRKLGTERDRRAASAYLSKRYLTPIDPDRVFLTSGSQNALFLLLSALCRRGDTILVEELTYRQIRDVADILGLVLATVELDGCGIVASSLEDQCLRHRPRLLYCIPTVQNPTASIMPAARRQEIATIARRHGVTVIEDEAQGLIPNDAPPPIATFAPELTWTVTGLSKCLLVGMRIAYVTAPENCVPAEVLGRFEGMAFWYASGLPAAFATRHIESGLADDMLRDIRIVAARRQALAADFFGVPPGTRTRQGLHFWLTDADLSGEDLRLRLQERRVLVRSACEYAIDCDPARPGVRISLADIPEDRLTNALVRLVTVSTGLEM